VLKVWVLGTGHRDFVYSIILKDTPRYGSYILTNRTALQVWFAEITFLTFKSSK